MKFIIAAALAAASVSAAANIVQEARAENGAAVLLFDEQGTVCVAPARRAQYVSPRGDVTEGCFKLIGLEAVQIAFVDGDAMQLPIGVFKAPKKT